jgi:hypothetical protein
MLDRKPLLASMGTPGCAARQNMQTYICVSSNQFSHITGRVLVKLLVASEDENRNINGAEHGELMGFLEKTTLSLEEGAATGKRR